MSTNAECAIGVTLARTLGRGGTITARRTLSGSRTLGESVGRASGALSDRTFRRIGVTARTALNAASLLGRSVSAAQTAFASFSTTLTFNDIGHANRL